MKTSSFGIFVLIIGTIPTIWLLWNGRSSSDHDLQGESIPPPGIIPIVVGQSEQNDIDRLARITERYCRAAGSRVVAIFGSASSSNALFVSIDYGIFNRLSDDGVAVLLAQAFLYKNVMASEINTLGNLPPDPLRLRRQVLDIDEQVGHQMAKGGFRTEGFKEWLECMANEIPEKGFESVSSNLREPAFLRGYESVSKQP